MSSHDQAMSELLRELQYEGNITKALNNNVKDTSFEYPLDHQEVRFDEMMEQKKEFQIVVVDECAQVVALERLIDETGEVAASKRLTKDEIMEARNLPLNGDRVERFDQATKISIHLNIEKIAGDLFNSCAAIGWCPRFKSDGRYHTARYIFLPLGCKEVHGGCENHIAEELTKKGYLKP
ncbi:MAG: hypothetical protein Q9162_005879 [Coniocarpon cinnabarinum]